MKKWVSLIFFTVLIPGSLWSVSAQDSPPAAAAPQPGRLSEEQLGEMLAAVGLQPKKTEQRYDFAFKMNYRGEEWKFSMSAVLSRNGESVWVMAWLDQIPQTSAEVPRTALLRLLAANDRLGEGKFFAYIPTNKRFVMQRVIPNRDLTNKKMMETLQDLASSVADEYPRGRLRTGLRRTNRMLQTMPPATAACLPTQLPRVALPQHLPLAVSRFARLIPKGSLIRRASTELTLTPN
ncbi:MAG UNVERIFIED_CONTAM: hypothetical protein LVR18_11605 [Planctomycetaceae bacterium]|jgi:hypothetical protein